MSKDWHRIIKLGMALLLGVLVACTAPAQQPHSETIAPTAITTPVETSSELNQNHSATPSASLIETLKTLLTTEQGIASSDLFVKQTEAVEWSDSCLGAAHPNEMCAQVITPGYRIRLGTLTETFEFHTDQTGRNIRKLEAAEPTPEAEKSKRSVEAEAEQADENHSHPSP